MGKRLGYSSRSGVKQHRGASAPALRKDVSYTKIYDRQGNWIVVGFINWLS